MHSFLPAYLGGIFFPLLEVSERNFFFQVGGRCTCTQYTPPPAYAPGSDSLFLFKFLFLFLFFLYSFFTEFAKLCKIPQK